MNIAKKALLALAYEGPVGLMRKGREKLLAGRYSQGVSQPVLDQRRGEYQAMKDTFRERSESMDQPELPRFCWYHTVDLGNGLVTPGDYDYRSTWGRFGFPDDFSGLRVLDIGSATGFFAFEFHRRGAAEVVSVELPSIADWDIPRVGEKERVLQALMEEYGVDNLDDLHHRHLEGPFQFCREALGAEITRVHSRIYDLTLDKLGGRPFDVVFLGDVLAHLFSPLAALDAVAPLVNGKLILSQVDPSRTLPEPIMHYRGLPSRSRDGRTWWHPNLPCLEGMLQTVGFQKIWVHGHLQGVYRPTGGDFSRVLIHASR